MNRGDFLNRLYEYCEEGQIETRALPKKKQAFHQMRDWASIDKWCEANSQQNLYFAVATRNGGGTKDHINQIPACWLDIDYKDFANPQAAKKTIWGFQYRPTVIVASGGGLHCYWKFKEPAGRDEIAKVEKLNKALAQHLGGDAQAVDASRILRLPESINHKYENKPAVRVARQDWTFEYNIDDLLADPLLLYKLESVRDYTPYCTAKKGDFEPNMRDTALQSVTERYILHPVNFAVGHHDETLFSLALHLAKGGMPQSEVLKVIEYTAKTLDPEGEVGRWADEKVASAFKRLECQERNLAQEIRDWLSVTKGYISVTECDKELEIVTKRYKTNRRVIFHRLLQDGFIERHPERNNLYRRVEKECDEIDFLNAPTDEVDITLPLGLSDLFKAYRKNIILIAGDQDAGKTAILLNFVKDNMDRHRILYFSSEMAESEMRSRLELFPDLNLRDWKFEAKERSSHFADVIEPDAINIIDYLEMDDAFYRVSGKLREIHDKLDKGIAIIALQKTPSQDLGRGGSFSLEKPRLYLSISNDYPGHTAKVIKCKNWRTSENPNGLKKHFKLYQGHAIVESADWNRDN